MKHFPCHKGVFSSALLFHSSLQTWILSSKPPSGSMTSGQSEAVMSSSCWWGTKPTWQTRGNGGPWALLPCPEPPGTTGARLALKQGLVLSTTLFACQEILISDFSISYSLCCPANSLKQTHLKKLLKWHCTVISVGYFVWFFLFTLR